MWRSRAQKWILSLMHFAACLICHTTDDMCSFAVFGRNCWPSPRIHAEHTTHEVLFLADIKHLFMQVTEEFLEFTKSRGNDLSTPRPPSFPGLNPGDRWCLCVSR